MALKEELKERNAEIDELQRQNNRFSGFLDDFIAEGKEFQKSVGKLPWE